MKGRCPHPDHPDHTASFYILTKEHRASCFGCSYFVSSPIELMATIMSVTEVDALQYIQENFNVSFLPKKLQAELEAQRINQKTKNAVFKHTHDIMCDAIANPTKHPYAAKAIDWLINVRKIPQTHLHTLPIGIMPSLLELVDGMSKRYQALYKAWKQTSTSKGARGPKRAPEDFSKEAGTYLSSIFKTSMYNGSIVFPLHSSPSDVARLKLRQPNQPGTDKKFIIPEDEYEEHLGIFGLGWDLYEPFFNQLKSKTNIPFVYIVEGEMDALSVMAQFAVSGNVWFPLMSVGGSGGAAHIQPILNTIGTGKAFMVSDAPSANGDIIIREWLKKAPDVKARVFTGWDKLVPSTDVDEALNDPNVGFNKVVDTLWKKSDDNFVAPWKWAYDHAAPELDSIPDHDRRSLIEKAADHGKFLQHRLERDSYITAITDDYKQITPNILKRELARKEENELGFIYKCSDALKEMFFVIGTRIKTNGRYLILQNKKEQTFHEMRINSGDALIQELAPLVGSPYLFVDQDVGFPSFLTDPKESDGPVMALLDKQLTFYLKESVNVLSQGAPDFQAAERRKQGYHFIEREDDENLEYIVCGKDVFKITREERQPPQYTKLEGPADNNLIFDINFDGPPPTSWFPGGLNVNLLNEGAKTDLNQLFEDIKQYYNCAFKFKNQEVTSTFLAAILMCYPVMDAFERPVITFITGDSNSGKSTLLAT